MAIDIEALGLPFIPGAETGLYELPDDQSERIARYLGALFEAKVAGVLGQEIRHPQAYVNKVVSQRVTDARAGGKAWQDRCAEMDRDEQAWAIRMTDHSMRKLNREPTATGPTGDEAALSLARRSETLDAATLKRLADRDLDVIERDERRTEEITLGRIDPRIASIRARAFRRLRAQPEVFDKAWSLFGHLPAGVQEAAIALAVWDELSLPEQAVLYGPWGEIVDGDATAVEQAWSDPADRGRSSFRDLPPRAFDWFPGKEDDSF